MKIKVFSHAVNLTGDISITVEQTQLLEDTGLLAAAEEVNMMLHYKESDFAWLKERWKHIQNVKYKTFDDSYREWQEGTTILHIQDLVHSTDEEFYVLYMHHKGVYSKTTTWRHYMQYWNIEKWKECVQHLDEGYDTCGASFLTADSPTLTCGPYPIYAGNFWWARASYLRKCRILKTPVENNYEPQFVGQPHHRYDYECWHGSGNPKAYDMHFGPERRWYWPANMYRN
jgi:hypothetical protein